MRDGSKLLLVCLALAACTAWVQHDPFFWDTVQLGSKHAHFFYQNGLHWVPLPTEIDSGHPPVFGFCLAALWSVLGKSLQSGHWAMFPFLCGIAALLLRLGRRFGDAHWSWGLVALVFLDPVMAAQMTLVSPDIVLVFCLLLAVEGALENRLSWIAFGVLGLCAISTRGMMTSAALFAWQVVAWWRPGLFFQPHRRFWLAFLPGFAFAAWFLIWHYEATGWVGFHAASPWSASFQRVDAAGFLRNVAILGWRWTDLGRLFEWAALGFLLYTGGWRRKWAESGNNQFRILLLLLACLLFFLSPSALLYRNLSAHRYLLPQFLGFHLLVFFMLIHSNMAASRRNILATLVALGLLTGNLWIYPRGISMDWDATLAYRPYLGLRAEMLAYLDEQKIDFQSVGTTFPNVNSGENLFLNGDMRCFAEKDFERNTYILTSNVFNDFSEEEYHVLEHEWVLVKKVEQTGVWMMLFRKANKSIGSTDSAGKFPNIRILTKLYGTNDRIMDLNERFPKPAFSTLYRRPYILR